MYYTSLTGRELDITEHRKLVKCLAVELMRMRREMRGERYRTWVELMIEWEMIS